MTGEVRFLAYIFGSASFIGFLELGAFLAIGGPTVIVILTAFVTGLSATITLGAISRLEEVVPLPAPPESGREGAA